MICEVSYIQIEVYHWIKAFFSPKEFLEDMIQTLTDLFICPRGFSLQNYLLPTICSQASRHKMRFPYLSDIFIHSRTGKKTKN